MQLQDLQFVSHTFRSPLPGPKLIITGAVHGNEVCGTLAIRRLLEQLQSGALQLISGQLTLVPVCNPLAYAKGERQGERNLNRRLIPTAHVQEFEDHVANWLCPLLAAHEVLLDLHSFRGAGEPFVLVGPENNQGEIEPFRHAEAELAMAVRLGVQRMVDGWLSTYAHGVARRQQALAPDADAKTRANADTRFGVGTTEYMRSVGGKPYFESLMAAFDKYKNEHIAVYGPDNRMRLTGLHETQSIDKFNYGIANRGASIRVPHSFANNGYKGYLEDRRPNSQGDPYKIASRILQTIATVPTP